MKFEIEFDYTFTYVPHRHFNKRSAWAKSSGVIEIQHVRPDCAPVVMELGNLKKGQSAARSRYDVKENGELRKVRAFEGKLFLEAQTVSAYRKSLEAMSDQSASERKSDRAFFSEIFRYGSARLYDATQKGTTTLQAIIDKERQPLKSFEDDGGQKTRDKLDLLSSLCIIVDDVVYEWTPEPVLCQDHSGVRIDARPAPETLSSDDSILSHFYTHSYWARNIHPLQYAQKTEAVDFIVHDPSFSTYDSWSQETAKQASDIVSDMKAKLVGTTRGYMSAALDLRDAQTDAADRVTPSLLKALAAITDLPSESREETARLLEVRQGTFHSSYARDKLADHQYGFLAKSDVIETNVNSAADAARAALAKWDSRPIGTWREPLPGSISSAEFGSRLVIEVLSEGHAVDLAALAGIKMPADALALFRNCDALLAEIPLSKYSRGEVVLATVTDGHLERATPVDGADHFEEYMEMKASSAQFDDTEIHLPSMGGGL